MSDWDQSIPLMTKLRRPLIIESNFLTELSASYLFNLFHSWLFVKEQIQSTSPTFCIIITDTVQSHLLNLWLIAKRINLLHQINLSKFQLLVQWDRSNQLSLQPSIRDQSIPLPHPFHLLAHRQLWLNQSITTSHFWLSVKYYQSNSPIYLSDVTPAITLTNL